MAIFRAVSLSVPITIMPEERVQQPASQQAPAHPAVVVHLLDALAGECELPAGIAAIVGVDPAMTLWAMSTAALTRREPCLPTLAESIECVGLASLKTQVMNTALDLLGRRERPAERVQSWRQALRCAQLGEGIARDLSHPQPFEARLAGLLHNLWPPAASGWNRDTLLRERDAALAAQLDTWNRPSMLPDALRYQHWPLEVMRDASTNVQIQWVARALTEAGDRSSLTDLADLLGMTPEHLSELQVSCHNQADNTLSDFLNFSKALYVAQGQPLQLHHSLVRFVSLEQIANSVKTGAGKIDSLAVIARHLQTTHGLDHALFFRLDKAQARLVSCPILADEPYPVICIDPSRSEAAAAMAFQWRRPVTAVVETNGAGACLLDIQLARMARREGVMAIPVGQSVIRGVLVACGDRDQLSALGEDTLYLTKLGMLAACEAVGSVTTGSGAQTPSAWRNHARQLTHEINNPLGIIKNYLALLRVRLESDGVLSDELRIIHEELDRITRIVQNLAIHENEDRSTKTEVDVNALIVDLIKVAAAGLMMQKRVQIFERLEERLPRLHCDRDKLKQLLLNLILNAIEATGEQGMVTVESHHLVNHKMERQLEILVSNTGQAIAPELLPHLFEPVESTKGGEHAGLGLAIVRSLAADLHAAIACHSNNGLTTFRVLLPAG